jgi:hypothetical protein
VCEKEGKMGKHKAMKGLLDTEEEKGLAELEPTKKSKREPVEKLKMTGPFGGVCGGCDDAHIGRKMMETNE